MRSRCSRWYEVLDAYVCVCGWVGVCVYFHHVDPPMSPAVPRVLQALQREYTVAIERMSNQLSGQRMCYYYDCDYDYEY